MNRGTLRNDKYDKDNSEQMTLLKRKDMKRKNLNSETDIRNMANLKKDSSEKEHLNNNNFGKGNSEKG